jgi:hypothetical protein
MWDLYCAKRLKKVAGLRGFFYSRKNMFKRLSESSKAQKISPHFSFALSVSVKCFAECSFESFAETFDNCFKKFRFSIHFSPVFESILKIQATNGHQLEAKSYPFMGFTLNKQNFLFSFLTFFMSETSFLC